MTKNYLLFIYSFFLSFIALAQTLKNDTPALATTLTVGTIFTDNAIEGTNVGATNSNIPDPACASYNGGDIWYKATVGTSGNITIQITKSIDSNIYDTGLAIYSGSIDALKKIGCNDEFGRSSFSGITLKKQTPNQVLYIRVWNYNNSQSGTFQIAAFSSIPPTNDEPESAIELTIGTNFDDNKITGSNVGSTYSSTTNPLIPKPECHTYKDGDVWYKLTVGPEGSFITEITTAEGHSTNYAIYSGSLETLVTEAEVCQQGLGYIILKEKTPGEVFYIRVSNHRKTENYEISAYLPMRPVNYLPTPEQLMSK